MQRRARLSAPSTEKAAADGTIQDRDWDAEQDDEPVRRSRTTARRLLRCREEDGPSRGQPPQIHAPGRCALGGNLFTSAPQFLIEARLA